jgi:hypothetical protein
MWIEQKSGQFAGQARIGRVAFSTSGASLLYPRPDIPVAKGQGFKASYGDVESGDEYRVTVRGRPDLEHLSTFRARGKY